MYVAHASQQQGRVDEKANDFTRVTQTAVRVHEYCTAVFFSTPYAYLRCDISRVLLFVSRPAFFLPSAFRLYLPRKSLCSSLLSHTRVQCEMRYGVFCFAVNKVCASHTDFCLSLASAGRTAALTPQVSSAACVSCFVLELPAVRWSLSSMRKTTVAHILTSRLVFALLPY